MFRFFRGCYCCNTPVETIRETGPEELFNQGSYRKARKACQKILKNDPHNYEILMLKARCEFHLKKDTACRMTCTTILAGRIVDTPKQTICCAYLYRGRAFGLANETELMIADYKTAVDYNCAEPYVFISIAEFHDSHNDFEDAINFLNIYLTKHYNEPNVNALLILEKKASILYHNRQYADVIQIINTLFCDFNVVNMPNRLYLHARLAISHYRLEAYYEAMEICNAGIAVCNYLLEHLHHNNYAAINLAYLRRISEEIAPALATEEESNAISQSSM